jgi:hypothetical protein
MAPFIVEQDVRLSTAEEFLQALSPLDQGWGDAPHDWIFRGHADAMWKLIPSALRQPSPPLKYTEKGSFTVCTHKDQVDAEFGLLWEFFRVADSQGLLIPEDSQIYRSPWASETIYRKLEQAKCGRDPWPFDELLSLAALAQHHGVPTRLLDWANDAFIAAYFAASKASMRLDRWKRGRCAICGAKPGASQKCSQCDSMRFDANPDRLRLGLWGLNWRYIWERWPGNKPDNIEVLLVMAPRATNPNLHAQGGVFTVHLVKPGCPAACISPEALDKVIRRTAADIGIPFPVMRHLTLPVRQADRLLRLLAMQNIHAARVYPGFGGVVRHLKEWRLWDKPPCERDLPIH